MTVTMGPAVGPLSWCLLVVVVVVERRWGVRMIKRVGSW